MTEQPLKWRTVVVTRAHDQQGSLVSRLAVLGATVVELPATVVVDRVEGMATTHFTSADVVRHPLVARIVEAYGRADKDKR